MGRYLRTALFAFLLLLVEIAQICFCANSTVPCIETERQALLEFRASLRDPSNRLSSWKGIHCCQWEGIACDNVTGHVVKLDLQNPCVTPWPKEGRVIPENCLDIDFVTGIEHLVSVELRAPNVNSSLLQLEYLTYLDLSGNDFSGSPIPMFFGSMRRLKYLSLSHAYFSGRIPSSLGNLKSLHLLDLSGNFPLQTNDVNWISELESLEHLDMSGVNLRDTHNLFQVLNMLPSLLRIYLAHCELDNPLIPLVNLSKVQVLDLSENQLALPVLRAFQNTTSLVHLDFSWNQLNSPIPDAFRNLTSIQFLDLSYNYITSIPSWFRNFEKLVHLDLSWNRLHGPIPDAFRNLTSIQFLDLSINYITSIPSWFRNFEKLVHLDLFWNGLHGPIPNAFRNLTSIQFLDLCYNYITSIPSWFRNFEKLVHLDLSWNGLHGPIPDAFKDLTSVEFLDLGGNNFTSIPSWFSDFDKLVYLELYNNGLHGPIPDAFRNLTSIQFLDLSWNNFTSSVPSWFAELRSLVHVDLRQNKLTHMECSLSSILTNMCHLKSLYLSSNKLRGEPFGHHGLLSGCVRYDLEVLVLSNNEFSDRLPTWLGELVN